MMKVIYHIGKTIGFDTIAKKGIIKVDTQPIMIESKEGNLVLNDLKCVDLIKVNGLGTMIKVQNSSDIIYIAVPRIFIEIGTGFIIVNFFATKKLYIRINKEWRNQL
ncbi:hypothetical protein [Anaeromicropila herbilytica]|uniref:Uncharacterized protein n=1 Tax=Anaeromicropila herbilytica TaxID=2785025 RepID=A0A7R7ELE7_9FIRM|nr:hypothetical protein [Anaeromicropila herbilytica]BCN30954.1 hypothetical protein bsdtb5_22490 [Anaeromicropila herbilytica]